MDYVNENPMTVRDISPAQAGRQNIPEDHEESMGGCGCTPGCPWSNQCTDGWGLADHPLAMVYAPCQTFCALHDPATALRRGTLFSTLDLPLGCAEVGFTRSDCPCGRERR